MIDNIRKNNGFSLLEVLIAMAILAVGLLAIAMMQVNTTQGNAWSRDMSEAMVIAQDEVERLVSLDFDDAQLADTVAGNWVGNNFNDLTPGFSTSYLMDTNFPNAEVRDMNNPANLIHGIQYSMATYIQDDTSVPNMKTVAVAVSWPFQTGRGVVFVTTIAEPIL